jgi:uncharacterized protein (DUF983 family)
MKVRGHWPIDAGPFQRKDYTMTVSTSADLAVPERSITGAMRRGGAGKCPACGQGALFHRYLKVADRCPACAEELHHHRADDAPPYFTILIVGHLIVAGVMFVEEYFHPDYWLHILMWFPLTIGLSLWILPRVKGALVGLQWALRMHGFGGPDAFDPAAPAPDPAQGAE